MNLDAEGGILQCFTNKSGCCSIRPNREGEWKYPNGSLVQIQYRNEDFYRTRGKDPGVVNLIWTENAMIPEGMFCCEIPPNQKACIGMYPPDKGNGTVTVTIQLLIDSKTKYNCVGCVNRHPQGEKHSC